MFLSSRARASLWVIALGFTYFAGKLAVDPVKWAALMYLAPTAEAKLILIGYLASAVVPVLLLAILAAWAWYRLSRDEGRIESGLALAMELAFLTYVDVRDVQRALSNFLQ